MVTATELACALAAAGANVLGAVAVASRKQWSARALEGLVAFSAGFLISVVVVELFPEAVIQSGPSAGLVALAGYLLVHLTQHTLAPHFHFGEETHAVSETVSRSALVGLLLHTFVDGVAIASGFLVNSSVGFVVFTAIALHKFPEGLAISSLFLAAGQTRTQAVAAAGMLGAATVAGVFATNLIGTLAEHGLALSAGVMLYVGASNLVPEFQAKSHKKFSIGFFAGCAVYLLARAAVG